MPASANPAPTNPEDNLSAPPLIISVSGLRGIVGKTLTPSVAMRYAAALHEHLAPGVVLIGRDGRTTGAMLASSIIAQLTALGRDCVDVGVIATPTIGVLIRERGAAGAIQISASHNPPPYNGMKLFGDDGRVIDARRGAAVKTTYDAITPKYVTHEAIGTIDWDSDPHAPHLRLVLDTVDQIAIRAANFRVLLDSNHGAGGILGRRLLEALGCDVTVQGEEPTGKFAHTPEPTLQNLSGVTSSVVEQRCTVGFCQDPDADRLALIDEKGRYVGEEYTLALCISRAMSNPVTRGPVVINAATSSMNEIIAKLHGQTCYRSAVGEANVAGKMLEVSATYGGEGNGGPMDPRVGYVRDSFVGMAAVLELMAKTGKRLSELVDEIERREIVKEKASIIGVDLSEVLERIEKHFSDAQADRNDGLRLAWIDRWLLVRGSNTEPIVRFIAEATTAEEAKALCDEAAKLVDQTS